MEPASASHAPASPLAARHGLRLGALANRRSRKQPVAEGRSWPSLTAERTTTNGGHVIHSGRRWLERRLYIAPLSLVINNWLALDDPKRASHCAALLPESSLSAQRTS